MSPAPGTPAPRVVVAVAVVVVVVVVAAVAEVSWMWTMLVVTPIIAALCRDLISLYRPAVRRASIARMIRDCSGVIRIVDRTVEGDTLEIEVLPSGEEATGLDLRSTEA